jgi:hypothetical protein
VNGIQDGAEVAVDCGGTAVGGCSTAGYRCTGGQTCSAAGDCKGNTCGAIIPFGCTPSPCTCGTGSACDNGAKDGTESDVDCGGSCSGKCPDGRACNAGTDCASGVCVGAVCGQWTSPGSCSDGIKDGPESDIDCGRMCPARCSAGKVCVVDDDCTSGGICAGARCVTCSDGVKNTDESDIDCGGRCANCGAGRVCNGDDDCASGVCSAKVCL